MAKIDSFMGMDDNALTHEVRVNYVYFLNH